MRTSRIAVRAIIILAFISTIALLIEGCSSREEETIIFSYFMLPVRGDTVRINGSGSRGQRVSEKLVTRNFGGEIRYYRSDASYYWEREPNLLVLHENEEGCSYFFLPEGGGTVKLKRNDEDGIREIEGLMQGYDKGRRVFIYRNWDDENRLCYSISEDGELDAIKSPPEKGCS